MANVTDFSSQNSTATQAGEPVDVMTQILRQGAQQMLTAAIDAEVQEFLKAHEDQRDPEGRRLVVRNGYLP